MSSKPFNASSDYQPVTTISPPAIYAWPPRPLAALKYLLVDLLFPWNYMYIGLAVLCWAYLTPAMAAMANFDLDWIAMIWLRNAAVLTLFAGGLHWWLYMRHGQNEDFKFHKRWLDTDNNKFLWGDQVWDNMFWSLVSGVTIATAYEAITFWIYANGHLSIPAFADHPFYFVICVYGVFFLGTVHFYCIHRLSHWPPLYKISHELHHRNVNTGPWTGISMHPIEHLLYFSVMVIVWFIPVHPVIIVLISLWFVAGPAVSHSGFDLLKLKNKSFSTGDWYHQLHHQYFDLNYGNTVTPLDKVFGSWHNGSKDSLMAQKARGRDRRKNKAAEQNP